MSDPIGPSRRVGRALPEDVLFVALTRPAMRFGVTFTALLANAVVTLNIFLFSGNLLTLLLCLPVHGISALLCARDARIFDLLFLWARTGCGGWLGARGVWGCASYSALRLDPVRGGRRRAVELVMSLAPEVRR